MLSRLFQVPGNTSNRPSENIISWVHKEFKENDINATKHRLLCKLDDMSHGKMHSTLSGRLFNPFLARTIRSVSCHSFPANQRSDSVKRSSTEQQMNPGRHCPEINPLLQSTDLLENALYLTEIFTLTSSSKKLQLSTISLDSIEKDHDRIDLFLYDSLNDESEEEQYHDCSNDIHLLNTLVNQRRLIEQLTQRCSSLDSLDNDETKSSPSRMRVLSMNDACVENFPRLDLMCDRLNPNNDLIVFMYLCRICKQCTNDIPSTFNYTCFQWQWKYSTNIAG